MERGNIEVKDLYLVATLILGGALIIDIRRVGKMGVIILDVHRVDTERLAQEFDQVATHLRGVDVLTTKTAGWLYDGTILGRLDAEYRRLKKLMVMNREDVENGQE